MSDTGSNTGSMLMLASSMLIFGTIGLFRRAIPLSSGLLAFARGVIGAVFLGLFVKLTGRKILHGVPLRDAMQLLVSGALIGFNWILLFEAYNYTTVATATLCYYMQPTIVLLLSPLFLGEHLTGRKLLCAAFSLLGMLLVSGIIGQGLPAPGGSVPGGSGLGVLAPGGSVPGVLAPGECRGILCGLGAALLYAAVVIMNKKSRVTDPYGKTIVQLASAAVCLLPYLALTGQLGSVELSPYAAGMLLLVGVVHTGIAYALYFGSTQGLRAQTIAMFSYLDPVSALLLAALLLKEPMSLPAAVGAVLILGAAAVSELAG